MAQLMDDSRAKVLKTKIYAVDIAYSGGGNPQTNNIDVTSWGLTISSLERCLGCSTSGVSYASARIKCTSLTNLEVVAVGAEAATIRVIVLVVTYGSGTVRRYTTTHTTPSGGGSVLTNVPLSDLKDLTLAISSWCGTTPASGTSVAGSVYTSSTTNAEVRSASPSGNMSLTTNSAFLALAA